MKPFHDEIKALLEPVLGGEITIEMPPNPEMGDFAVPCFLFSKAKRKAPQMIATEALAAIKDKPLELIDKVETAGGYINFFVKPSALAESVLAEAWNRGADYGRGNTKDERVMIEYPSPNTHKSLHVGHLRNMALGLALVNISRFAGYPTLTANYINDTGTHVATSVWAYVNFYEGKEPEQGRGQWLGDLYVDAVARLELDPALKDQVYLVHRKIEGGDPKMIQAWEKTRQWSLEEMNETFKEMGLTFEHWYFDHELFEAGKAIVQELVDSGIAKESEGAIIVDLEPYKLGVGLILKSDGSALYITKDLALAKEKFNQHKIDRSVYVVGSEQQLHFKQLFKILELWGFNQAKKCYHMSYDLVMLPEGKMSSRAGNVILYRALADAVREKSYEEVQKRHPEWPEHDILKAREQISMAAMKFPMINQDTNKTIIFDIEKALDFYGETGPYCQYAHARACSVLKKSDIKVSEKVDFSVFKEPEELALLKLIAAFPEIVQSSANQYRPMNISRFCLDISQAFSNFYEKCPIIKADSATKKSRLLLLECSRVTLKNALGLIGIESPDQM